MSEERVARGVACYKPYAACCNFMLAHTNAKRPVWLPRCQHRLMLTPIQSGHWVTYKTNYCIRSSRFFFAAPSASRETAAESDCLRDLLTVTGDSPIPLLSGLRSFSQTFPPAASLVPLCLWRIPDALSATRSQQRRGTGSPLLCSPVSRFRDGVQRNAMTECKLISLQTGRPELWSRSCLCARRGKARLSAPRSNTGEGNRRQWRAESRGEEVCGSGQGNTGMKRELPVESRARPRMFRRATDECIPDRERREREKERNGCCWWLVIIVATSRGERGITPKLRESEDGEKGRSCSKLPSQDILSAKHKPGSVTHHTTPNAP